MQQHHVSSLLRVSREPCAAYQRDVAHSLVQYPAVVAHRALQDGLLIQELEVPCAQSLMWPASPA